MVKNRAMRSPRGICEIGPPRKTKVALIFREVAPGKKVAYAGPDPEVENRDAIKRMRRDARQVIIAEGGNPKRTAQIILDAEKVGQCGRAYFAASLYEQLARAENCLRVLLTCPAEDSRWHGLKFAREMDYSRFLWERLGLVTTENFIKAGEGPIKGGKKSGEAKQLAAEFNAKKVRAIFVGKDFAWGQVKVRWPMRRLKLACAAPRYMPSKRKWSGKVSTGLKTVVVSVHGLSPVEIQIHDGQSTFRAHR